MSLTAHVSSLDRSNLRRRWYAGLGRQYRLDRPVISVGNLSHGGRGKTPVAGEIARLLIARGERPAILTRGYARTDREDGAVVVSDGTHLLADVDRAGDEPLMLARDVPGACVVVGEQRALCGALAERLLGATVHVLDDGFQHLQLARDIDIVLVNGDDLCDRAVPFGRLREPVGALRFADAIVGEPGAGGGVEAAVGPAEIPRFELRRSIGAPVPLESDRPWDAPDRRVVAVAGIASPGRFAEMLASNGWVVVEHLDFRDHHRFSGRDLERMAEASSRTGAPVVTTSKDAMRLMPLRPLPVPVAYVPLRVAIEAAAQFETWLFERLARTGDGGAAPFS